MVQVIRTTSVVALVLLVVLAGCSGLSPASGDADSRKVDAEGGGGVGGTPSAKNVKQPARTELNAQAGRALIRTGHVRLEVANYDAARTNLTQIASEHGGYVSDSTERVHHRDNATWTTDQVVRDNATWTTGRVVIRIPAENFSAFYKQVKTEGTVLQAKTNTTDVTDRLVDLKARLKNLQAERDRLRTLYQRANDTETVLKVEQRLSEVQGEIERLEARRRALEKRIAYSTVIVELREPVPPPEKEPVEQWYEIGIIAAFLESVNGVVVTVRAIFVVVAYLAPYLVVFGLPLLGIGVMLRRRTT